MISWVLSLDEHDLELVKAMFGFVSTLSIFFGAFFAVIQLRVARRDRRSEWMWKLSSEFYANKDFKEIRRLFDDPSWKKWSEMSPDRFDDYLHFLEMVAVLSDTGQFEQKYVHAVFGYWVEAIGKREGSRVYLNTYGYAHLLSWVDRKPYEAPR
jgi:hypothetical protein